MEKLTYKSAGVDRELISKIKDYLRKRKPFGFGRVLRVWGKFSSVVAIPGGKGDIVMLASVDGVGTKLKLVTQAQRYELVGYDIVNHLVNDLIALNGRPSYFLDYISFSLLDFDKLKRIIDSIIRACEECGLELIGGETAQMPEFYREGEFELVGFCVGFAKESEIIDCKKVSLGDRLIGLPSSGLHTNGYSLARKALFEKGKISPDYHFYGKPLIEHLLVPHRNYLKETIELTSRFHLHGIVHITGGGLHGNLRNAIPQELSFELRYDNIPKNPIFKLIQESGDISDDEMFNTFNMGVGIVYILPESEFDNAYEYLLNKGSMPIDLGKISGG